MCPREVAALRELAGQVREGGAGGTGVGGGAVGRNAARNVLS